MNTPELAQSWVIVLHGITRSVWFDSTATQALIDEICKKTLADMAVQNEGGYWALNHPAPTNPLELELTPTGQPGSSSIQGQPTGMPGGIAAWVGAFPEFDDPCSKCGELFCECPPAAVPTNKAEAMAKDLDDVQYLHDSGKCFLCAEAAAVRQNDTGTYQAFPNNAYQNPVPIPDKHRYPRTIELLETSLEEAEQLEAELTRAKEVLESTRAISEQRAVRIQDLEREVRMLKASNQAIQPIKPSSPYWW